MPATVPRRAAAAVAVVAGLVLASAPAAGQLLDGKGNAQPAPGAATGSFGTGEAAATPPQGASPTQPQANIQTYQCPAMNATQALALSNSRDQIMAYCARVALMQLTQRLVQQGYSSAQGHNNPFGGFSRQLSNSPNLPGFEGLDYETALRAAMQILQGQNTVQGQQALQELYQQQAPAQAPAQAPTTPQ